MPRWAISVWDRDTDSWRYVLTAEQLELVGQLRRGIIDPNHLKVVALLEHSAPFAETPG
jgi:hypothetical protein